MQARAEKHKRKGLKRSIRKVIRGWPYICDLELARVVMASHYDHAASSSARINPYKIYHVCPHAVQWALKDKSYNNRRLFDFGLDGDWDSDVACISDMTIYRGLEQRFGEGRQWFDTVLSPQHVRPFEWPEPRQYLRYDRAQFDARTRELDRLWESLRVHGNLSRAVTEFSDLLNLAIDRSGRAIRICSGLHRLVMSQLQGIDAVPCRISIIHKRCAPEYLTRLNLKS